MAESDETTTVIAAEAQIKGELIFQGAASILGKVDGKITAKGNLHVAAATRPAMTPGGHPAEPASIK